MGRQPTKRPTATLIPNITDLLYKLVNFSIITVKCKTIKTD